MTRGGEALQCLSESFQIRQSRQDLLNQIGDSGTFFEHGTDLPHVYLEAKVGGVVVSWQELLKHWFTEAGVKGNTSNRNKVLRQYLTMTTPLSLLLRELKVKNSSGGG